MTADDATKVAELAPAAVDAAPVAEPTKAADAVAETAKVASPPEDAAPAEGLKRSPDGSPDGQPLVKVAKVEGGDAVKKDEKKEKKEKDKEKKEKKEKKDKKDNKEVGGTPKKPAAVAARASKGAAEEPTRDHRQLFKEGQKALTPPVADPTRAFYESLFKEKPDSKLAIKYCIENGVLSLEEHKKLLKRYLALKEKGVFNERAKLNKLVEKMTAKAGRTSTGGKDKKKDKKEVKEGKAAKSSPKKA